MKRYIEIIFDDSGSMNGFVNGEQKHIIAKKLFKEKILPNVGKKGDEIVLRRLSDSCSPSCSFIESLPNDINEMSRIIDSIKCNKSTPLYYTIKDSIDACRAVKADEKHIFILTDGDDTCMINPESILGKDFGKIKDQLNLNTILIQFAISDSLSQNNLTAFAQKLGATNVVINSNDLKDFDLVEKKITKAFITSGVNKNSKFPHCFDTLTGDTTNFDLLELFSGFDFYLVEILYKEKLLSWKPLKNKKISATQLGELDFIYTLRFKNNLPESTVKQMLTHLQFPYKYSFDYIYWDFKERVWKYFPEIPEVNLLPNPEAGNADLIESNLPLAEKIRNSERYLLNKSYRVVLLQNSLIPVIEIQEINYEPIRKPIELRDGNVIVFNIK